MDNANNANYLWPDRIVGAAEKSGLGVGAGGVEGESEYDRLQRRTSSDVDGLYAATYVEMSNNTTATASNQYATTRTNVDDAASADRPLSNGGQGYIVAEARPLSNGGQGYFIAEAVPSNSYAYIDNTPNMRSTGGEPEYAEPSRMYVAVDHAYEVIDPEDEDDMEARHPLQDSSV